MKVEAVEEVEEEAREVVEVDEDNPLTKKQLSATSAINWGIINMNENYAGFNEEEEMLLSTYEVVSGP